LHIVFQGALEEGFFKSLGDVETVLLDLICVQKIKLRHTKSRRTVTTSPGHLKKPYSQVYLGQKLH